MGPFLARPKSTKARSRDVEMTPERWSLPFTQPIHRGCHSTFSPEELEARCNIQPHTDEGGDAYYIGDAYDSAKCAHEWAINDGRERPYLQYVKRISKAMPHLQYLAHWMEVTAAPPKWRFIKEHPPNREQRARRCKACVLDFTDDQKLTKEVYSDTARLKNALDSSPQTEGSAQIRLIIVEDLSRDLIELLGARYDVDPLFFLSHISDYLFHNTRDPWVELPDLDSVARQRPHFNLSYLRARYFERPESFDKAEVESGTFNVLRRLDSDRSRKRLQNSLLDVNGASVTLTRSKTSLWVRPTTSGDDTVLAILLVDPTVKTGFPLWGGYRPFGDTPSMHEEPMEAPPRTTLFDDAVYWSSKMTKQDLELVRVEPRCIALPMLRLVLADWRTVSKYMTTMLGKIEWEFEDPHWGEKPSDIDASLRKLSPWRRNVPYYQTMIAEAIDRIFPLERFPLELRTKIIANQANTPTTNTGMLSLLPDFRIVQQLMDASLQRIETIQTMATNSINIEESRRAVQQNKNLARLTFLATIFIPMSFTSSFLSMSPDFKKAEETIWMFFAIGIPLTLLALVIVDLSHPQEGLILKQWRTVTAGKKPPPTLESREASPKVEIGKTMPWPMASFGSSYTGQHKMW